LCSYKTSLKLSKYDFIVEKLSAVDRAVSIVRKKHVLIRGCRLRKRSTYRSKIELNSFSLLLKLRSDRISEARILTN
jgi:hypothetical protein